MGTRRCAGCDHRASAHARFCERCGAPLTPTATPLRAPSTLEARILDGRPSIEGERKQVTVLYADIVGSMDLTRSLDAERWGFVLDRFLAITAGAVHAYEGTVNQFTGDGLMAVFGAPLAHEDHARRACLAALELRREVDGLAAEVSRSDGVAFAIRCGLNSGEVVVGAIGDDVHMDFVPLGNTTALGKRIESLAPVGSAALSSSTAALVDGEFELRELGEFDIKGADRRQRLLELVGPGAAQTRLQAVAATRGLSPFIGRDVESEQLAAALGQALVGHGRAVGVVGDAGVGKSRLVHEFVAGCVARGYTVTSTSGVAHGRFVPFLPVLALLRDAFGVDDRDSPGIARDRIATKLRALGPTVDAELPLLFEFLGIADPSRPPERLDPVARQSRLLAVATRAITARGRHEPLVLVVEDLHWLDDASRAFLDELVAAVAGTRTLLVGTYRPEHEAAWTGSPPHAELRLAPLAPDATDDLLAGLLGHDPSLGGLGALIETRTGGNPFFVEEVVHALVEDGHLTGPRGAYRLAAELQHVVLPATVQAGLAARIDRLPPREKALVQTMSVIGNEIPAPLLSAVSELPADQLVDAVDALARAQWVIAHGAGGGREYAFKHPLMQEVAYRSQLSERRAQGHRAVAAAIERTYPEMLDERAALLAHHCEASGDEISAAGWHARAAVWAERTSPADSMRHWRRVRQCASALDASPQREALATKARIGMLGLAWRLGMSPEETATIRSEARADAGQLLPDLFSAGTLIHSGREREGLEAFRQASRRAVAAGDPGHVLTASMGVAYASWIAGSLREAKRTLDHALALPGVGPKTGAGLAFVCALAHAFGHRGQCAAYLGDLETAVRDSDRALELAREHDDRESESAAHASLALLLAEAGQTDAALDNAALGLEIAQRAGLVIHAVACAVPAAVAQAGAGRFAEALAGAEENLAAIREHRIGLYFEPLLLATVARSELALGDPGAALAAAEEAVSIMDERGLTTCALAAPLALAEVLAATEGAAAAERIETVLAGGLEVARASGARSFERRLRRELTALALAR